MFQLAQGKNGADMGQWKLKWQSLILVSKRNNKGRTMLNKLAILAASFGFMVVIMIFANDKTAEREAELQNQCNEYGGFYYKPYRTKPICIDQLSVITDWQTKAK